MTKFSLSMVNKVDAYFESKKEYFQNTSSEFYFMVKMFKLKWNKNDFYKWYAKA